MPTDEDLKNAEDEATEEAARSSLATRGSAELSEGEREALAEGERDAQPLQMGSQRFVYAAYMAGAMLVAFLVAKSAHVAWYRLGQWKPEFGEPKDEAIYVGASIVGVLVALYYWRKASSRQYANEVAEELSKVTWPSKKEVWNSTTVVIFTTLFATVFFALMDQFWKYVTDKIYSF